MLPPRKMQLTITSQVSVYQTMAETIVENFGGAQEFDEACRAISKGEPLKNSKGFDGAARTLFLFTRQRKSFIEGLKQAASSIGVDDFDYISQLVHEEFPLMPKKDIKTAYQTLCEKPDFTNLSRKVIDHCYVVQNHIVLKVVSLIIDRVNTLNANKSNGWAIFNNPENKKPMGNNANPKYVTIVL